MRGSEFNTWGMVKPMCKAHWLLDTTSHYVVSTNQWALCICFTMAAPGTTWKRPLALIRECVLHDRPGMRGSFHQMLSCMLSFLFWQYLRQKSKCQFWRFYSYNMQPDEPMTGNLTLDHKFWIKIISALSNLIIVSYMSMNWVIIALDNGLPHLQCRAII